MIEGAVRRADNALLHAQHSNARLLATVGSNPEKSQLYYEITKYDREISTERKMRKITEIDSEYMWLAFTSLKFGHNPDSQTTNTLLKRSIASLLTLLSRITIPRTGPNFFNGSLMTTSMSRIQRCCTNTLEDMMSTNTSGGFSMQQKHSSSGGFLLAEPVHLGFNITNAHGVARMLSRHTRPACVTTVLLLFTLDP
mgnify:CR=1 FL=1